MAESKGKQQKATPRVVSEMSKNGSWHQPAPTAQIVRPQPGGGVVKPKSSEGSKAKK